jgi:hypothetical protein
VIPSLPSVVKVLDVDAEIDTTLLDSIVARVIEPIVARLIEPIATQVVEMIREEGILPEPSPPDAWLSAAEVARRLRVKREWVYQHADELGAMRIGGGRRPRLRFPPRLDPRREPAHPQPNKRTRGDGRKPEGLIPIYDGYLTRESSPRRPSSRA